MKKAKIIAIIMAVVLAITCLASSLSVFAKTQTITLDTQTQLTAPKICFGTNTPLKNQVCIHF